MLKRPPSVLVVDDDEPVCELIEDVLVRGGLTVATATTGLAALDLLDHADFDVVVADVSLPGELSGTELIQAARIGHPSLRCLFISGSADPTTDDPDRDDFVAKPFRINELLGCVWELLLRPVPERRSEWPARQAGQVLAAAKLACLKNQAGADGRKRRRRSGNTAQTS